MNNYNMDIYIDFDYIGEIKEMSKRKKNTLLLVQTVDDDYAYLEWKRNGFNTEIIMKSENKLFRVIRGIWLRIKLPGESMWYAKWKKDIRRYDTILVHASAITMGVPRWIKSKNKNARVILWYWNPVNKRTLPKTSLHKYCEIWSFDINNCKKYNMNYNPQYYFRSKKLPTNKESNDIFFIGSDKGRAKIVEYIYEICQKNNLTTDLNIVTNEIKGIKYNELLSSQKMSYDEILIHISKAKAILEILQVGQSSPTLRTFEALFFAKKLITNNLEIQKFDFYNKNNIFIIGKDDIKKLPEFIIKPYENIDNEVIKQYDVDVWFMRFFQGIKN